MGTNYYARIIPSKERKEHLKQLIDENKFNEIQEEVNLMYGSDTQYSNGAEIHLGKRSAGWKFLFNPNFEKYYPLTKEGLMNFLKRDDVIIYSEYFGPNNGVYEYTDDPDDCNKDGEYLWTPKQFMDMALNWNKDYGLTGKEYEESEHAKKYGYGSYKRYGDDREAYWIERGYKPEYYNFFNDGMRWSTCCEFS